MSSWPPSPPDYEESEQEQVTRRVKRALEIIEEEREAELRRIDREWMQERKREREEWELGAQKRREEEFNLFMKNMPCVLFAISIASFCFAMCGVSSSRDMTDCLISGIIFLVGGVLFRGFSWFYGYQREL